MGAGYSEFRYSAQDGLQLSARVYPAAGGGSFTPVVCLAGLTRNAHDFHELALKLSRDDRRPRKVVAFDYRGRGRSAHDPDWRNYDVLVEADDVLAGLVALGIPEAVFIGTSRGGLIIHVLAALRPSVLKAVVLNDVGPVIQGEGLAQIRGYLERAPKPRSWSDAVEIQKTALGRSFPALADEDWERMARAVFREEKGRIVPDFDRKLLKPLMRIDFDAPLPILWPQFDGLRAKPLMVVRGENSSLLSESTVREMAERHPGMISVTVEGQGHAPLLETGELPGLIADFAATADHR